MQANLPASPWHWALQLLGFRGSSLLFRGLIGLVLDGFGSCVEGYYKVPDNNC